MTEPFEYIAKLRGQYGLKDKLLSKYKFIVINVNHKMPQMVLLTGHKKSKLFKNFLKALLMIKYNDNYNLIYNLYDSKLDIYDA